MGSRVSEKQVGEEIGFVYALMGTWESLGILVHRREIRLGLVRDFLGGPILTSWRVLERFLSEERRDLGRDTTGEWFQWLAERMMEREACAPPVPAHVAYKNWKARD